MTMDELKAFLIWTTVINYVVVVVWFVAFACAHDWMYRMHSRWFKLSVETFDALHYLGISVYKIGVLLLSLVPLIAVIIIS